MPLALSSLAITVDEKRQGLRAVYPPVGRGEKKNLARHLSTHQRVVSGHDTLSPGQTVFPTQTNSSKIHNCDGVGYRLAIHLALVGLSWLEFDQAQIFAQLEPGFPPFGHLSQFKLTLAKLFCYCYVTTRSYSQTIKWFLVCWLDLAVSFGHLPMQVSIL